MTPTLLPPLAVPGFSWLGKNIGIKDTRLDFAVMHSAVPCVAAGVFTRNNFPGAPVVVGRRHLADGRLQTVVVNSKNANVATGPQGVEHALEVCRQAGRALGVAPELVLPSSTGVIGVRLPVEKIVAACDQIPAELKGDDAAVALFARAIMTTDTRPKAASVKIGQATLTGVAKGAGMIEPNMATMLAFLATDAQLDQAVLQGALSRVAEKTFNRVSVDTDTSTSDTAVVLANGQAGPVDPQAFEAALFALCAHLAREIARDGEGATKLIELTVEGAASPEIALAYARSIVNSPLVKTAIHGADPNWGRFVMAIGKVFAYPAPLEALTIRFGADPKLAITAQSQSKETLAAISAYLKQPEVRITVRVGDGPHAETMWGCDLSREYVAINADYTT